MRMRNIQTVGYLEGAAVLHSRHLPACMLILTRSRKATFAAALSLACMPMQVQATFSGMQRMVGEACTAAAQAAIAEALPHELAGPALQAGTLVPSPLASSGASPICHEHLSVHDAHLQSPINSAFTTLCS